MNQLLLYDDAYYGASNNGISSSSTWIHRQCSYEYNQHHHHRRIVGDGNRNNTKEKPNKTRPVSNLESIPNLNKKQTTSPRKRKKKKRKKKKKKPKEKSNHFGQLCLYQASNSGDSHHPPETPILRPSHGNSFVY
ncbi:hypothetical protein J3E68DRAFT_316856 [Trichoderma sp. SZMC 28012]